MNKLSFKHVLLRWRRRFLLYFGITTYCKVGYWELLQEVFQDQPPGIFLEAGAHDGWTGSNTYWLEASLGWRGILIEPVPGLYQACCKERPFDCSYHGALVSHSFTESTIDIECAGLVSAVTSSPLHHETKSIAEVYYGTTNTVTVAVPALTLDYCIMRSGYPRVDFISLDVEGFEVQALRGIDLDRWRVQYLFVECNDEQSVIIALGTSYSVYKKLDAKNILFKRTSPFPF